MHHGAHLMQEDRVAICQGVLCVLRGAAPSGFQVDISHWSLCPVGGRIILCLKVQNKGHYPYEEGILTQVRNLCLNSFSCSKISLRFLFLENLPLLMHIFAISMMWFAL